MRALWTFAIAVGGPAVGGCAGATEGPGEQASPPPVVDAPLSATAPATVTVRGQVLAAPDAGLADAEVSWLPSDPYLVALQATRTDPDGSFALGDVAVDAQDWFVFDDQGYQGIFAPFDITSDSQELPAVTLLASADAVAWAKTLGVTLDPDRVVIRMPVTVADAGATAAEWTVSAQPPLDQPAQYANGEVVVLNALATDSYQVTLAHRGQTCAPASHPGLVAADGSVEVRTLFGFWTVGPAMVCP
jgi:hypothetical protein